MNTSLKNKRALVCGASKGIGRAIAIALSELGANVTCLARSAQGLDGTLDLLDQSMGQSHDVMIGDLMEMDSILTQLESRLAEETFHILINNTGGPKGGAITDAAEDQFVNAFKQHIISAQKLATLLVPHMEKANYGRIINIISTSVKEPIPGLGVSNTIRGAMGNWAKTMAIELGAKNITVNNVLPGFTNTSRLESIIENKANKANTTKAEMAEIMKGSVPMKRFAEPKEVAAGVAFLASPAASYINGINLPVDGGRTKSL